MVAFGLLSPAEGAVAYAFGDEPSEEHDDEYADKGGDAGDRVFAELAKGAVEPLGDINGNGRFVYGGLEFVLPALCKFAEGEAKVLCVLGRDAHEGAVVSGEVDDIWIV